MAFLILWLIKVGSQIKYPDFYLCLFNFGFNMKTFKFPNNCKQSHPIRLVSKIINKCDY